MCYNIQLCGIGLPERNRIPSIGYLISLFIAWKVFDTSQVETPTRRAETWVQEHQTREVSDWLCVAKVFPSARDPGVGSLQAPWGSLSAKFQDSVSLNFLQNTIQELPLFWG